MLRFVSPALPFSVVADYAGRSVKGQLTQAGRLGARSIVRVDGATATMADGDGERVVGVDEIAQAVLG